jgi:hypothetical protein
MLLQRTGVCLLRALAVTFWLRVLFASIWEEDHCNRYRCAVR